MAGTIFSETTLMEDDEDKKEPPPPSVPQPPSVPAAQSAIDLTAQFLRPLLSPENVANLVSRGGSAFHRHTRPRGRSFS